MIKDKNNSFEKENKEAENKEVENKETKNIITMIIALIPIIVAFIGLLKDMNLYINYRDWSHTIIEILLRFLGVSLISVIFIVIVKKLDKKNK